MSLEQAMVDVAAALNANTAILERVVAGQEAAMAKLEGAKAPAARTPRAKKDDATTGAADAGAAGAAEAAAEKPKPAAAAAAVLTQDDLKTVAMDWRNGTAEGSTERAAANTFFTELAAHFGVAKFVGPEGINDAEQIKQAIFLVKRKKEGLSVDFAADYDFDGDPCQGAESDPANGAEEDPFA